MRCTGLSGCGGVRGAGGGGWCCFCGGVVWLVHRNASPCLPPPVSCVQLAPQGRPSLPEQVRLSTHMLSRFDGCTQLLPIRRKVTHSRVWQRKPFPFNGPQWGSQQQHSHMHPHAVIRLVYLLLSRVVFLPAPPYCAWQVPGLLGRLQCFPLRVSGRRKPFAASCSNSAFPPPSPPAHIPLP